MNPQLTGNLHNNDTYLYYDLLENLHLTIKIFSLNLNNFWAAECLSYNMSLGYDHLTADCIFGV